MFVVSFLQKVLATCDFRSIQRTVRVNPFPPLVWIDGEALGIAWQQFLVDMKTAENEELRLSKEPGAILFNDEVLWEELTSANSTTCNATQWKDPFKEEQVYPANIAEENQTTSQRDHQVPRQTIDNMENRVTDVSVIGSESQFLLQAGIFFSLGALLSTLFWKRRNSNTRTNAPLLPPAEAASIAQQTVHQKLVHLEQRMALLEAHEKIAHLQSQLQQKQSNYNKNNAIPTLVRNGSSNSHTLASSSNHEEALLTDRMLAATVTQDDDEDISSNQPNYSYEEDEAEQEVGLMLEDFQSELENIQENLRTGNFLLSPTVHDESVQRGVQYQ